MNAIEAKEKLPSIFQYLKILSNYVYLLINSYPNPLSKKKQPSIIDILSKYKLYLRSTKYIKKGAERSPKENPFAMLKYFIIEQSFKMIYMDFVVI